MAQARGAEALRATRSLRRAANASSARLLGKALRTTPARSFSKRLKMLSIFHSLAPPQSPDRLQADTGVFS